ncbi:3-oxoacyl-ACP reductase FabG [Mesorhizobium sp. AD1-1]|uniref:3-oxoacyl-ACP reductase FabG n=1 Tax=Mesorhizobium sp. AD1-1 TaxID=2876621 RepID=UPI001CCB4DA9|nr:3-oxoacyl-ACP reductase FabG [Mesorhizobium sp. AD1-1]MBZ9719194.1 3-oxoacyl-ACP reductase FabG [Mesorhizobium sp. AD1-1]
MRPDVAIVTGAARGIGAAICKRLEAAGWRVAGLDRSWDDDNVHVPVVRETVDVTDFDAVRNCVSRIESGIGPVAVLVNNAGITRDAMAHKMNPRDFTAVIDVNLAGPFHLIRAVLPTMREHAFGRIVSISSMNAQRGQAGQANYAAAKAGLIGLTKVVALENAARGITANCVAPGFIETDMTAAMRGDVRDAEIARIPAGRIGAPADIAGTVAFLASSEASFITGQVLSVNGGQLMP